jgi:hypothetical protein
MSTKNNKKSGKSAKRQATRSVRALEQGELESVAGGLLSSAFAAQGVGPSFAQGVGPYAAQGVAYSSQQMWQMQNPAVAQQFSTSFGAQQGSPKIAAPAVAPAGAPGVGVAKQRVAAHQRGGSGHG